MVHFSDDNEILRKIVFLGHFFFCPLRRQNVKISVIFNALEKSNKKTFTFLNMKLSQKFKKDLKEIETRLNICKRILKIS